jgi:VanZ family protein
VRRAELTLYWLPAVLWSAVLLLLSGGSGSAGTTSHFLAWLIPPTSPYFDIVHVILRKVAHLFGYSLLGALDFRAVRGLRRGWRLQWSVTAVGLATLIAALDELHQTMSPGRTGQVSDVVLDCGAAILAQVVYRLSIHRSDDLRDQSPR